jgi:hypothetical protein
VPVPVQRSMPRIIARARPPKPSTLNPELETLNPNVPSVQGGRWFNARHILPTRRGTGGGNRR